MLRESKGMTQTRLAELAKITQGAVSAYERDAVDGVPLAQIMRIVDALETTIQWVAYGEPVSDNVAKRYRSKP